MRNQLFFALVLLASCAHKQNQTAAVAPASSGSVAHSTPAVAKAATPGPTSCSADSECQANQLCVDGRCADAASIPECATIRVHFDFDKSNLHGDDQQRLDKFSRCVKAERATRFVIEGNCDERGTEEYNLALGDRRANAVAGYLTSLGAPKEQLRPVSYGKLRPICAGHEEGCWWQNRRADLQKESTRAAR